MKSSAEEVSTPVTSASPPMPEWKNTLLSKAHLQEAVTTDAVPDDGETTLKEDLARLEAANLEKKSSTDFKPLTAKPKKPVPPLIKRIRWFNLTTVVATPLISIYGIYTTPLRWETAVLTFVCWLCTTLGECQDESACPFS